MAFTSALGTRKSTGIYPAAAQQRRCSISNLTVCRGMDPLCTHKVTWTHTDNKARVQTGEKKNRRAQKQSGHIYAQTPLQVFLMEKHISPVKASRLRSLSLSGCGPGLINLFLTGAWLYVRDFIIFFCCENVLCADHFGRDRGSFICLAHTFNSERDYFVPNG